LKMNSSPHAQSFAYRRNPSQSVHQSTFHPGQVGHGHGSTTYASRPPVAHYATSASVSPFQPAQAISAPAEVKEKDAKPASSSGGFSLASLTKYANIDELKGLVDRFGGLEGILSTVTTVQKVVSTVGQIAPMVKVFTGVLGKNKEGATSEESKSIPARRRVRSTRPPARSGKSTTRRTGAAATTRRNSQARPAGSQRRSTPLNTRPTGRR